MSYIIESGGAVKDGEAPPPLNLGYLSTHIQKVTVIMTVQFKEAL